MFMLAHERVFGFGLAAAAVIGGAPRSAGAAANGQITIGSHVEAGERCGAMF